MNDHEMQLRLAKYENLIHCTVRRWRGYITTDMPDEDIAQELRLKAWRALESFDPSFGYPEEKHVFGAIRNRIKDLCKRQKREFLERPYSFDLDRWTGEIDDMGQSQLRHQVMNMVESRDTQLPDKHVYNRSFVLDGLSRDRQEVAMMIVQGYNYTEIAKIRGVKIEKMRATIASIKKEIASHLSPSQLSDPLDR